MIGTRSSSGSDNASADTVEGLQAALTEARCENEKQKQTVERMTAQMAALTEENEKLRKERDSLQEQLEEARTDLRETAEEMAAAARFSEKEWRGHCGRLEQAMSQLREMVDCCLPAALELLPGAEEAARRRLQDAETAARPHATRADMYRSAVAAARSAEDGGTAAAEAVERGASVQLQWLCRALDCTREELEYRYLTRRWRGQSLGHFAAAAVARGLWELYLALCDVGFPTDAAMVKLLAQERKVRDLYFTTTTTRVALDTERGDSLLQVISAASAYDFLHRLLRHLPDLQSLRVYHFPPLSSPDGRAWLSGIPRTVTVLALFHTKFTVADLLALYKRCPQLLSIDLHASDCTDWGAYAHIDDVWERRDQLNEECDRIIFWCD